MLEQKEQKENIIEELNDVDSKNEEVMEMDSNEGCTTCEISNADSSVKPTFVDSFKASLIDLIVIGGISAVGVFVVDAVLRFSGYFITEKFQMSFIIFMIVMVLYMSLMESGKNSATIGKKVSRLIITRR